MNPKYHLLVAIAALSLGACSTDDTTTDPVPEKGGYKISFTVAEDTETRTTFDAKDVMRWVPTDEVGIYTVGKNENPNTLTVADVNQSPVEFIGVLKKLVSPGDMFYAYYPYNAEQSAYPSSVKLSIPAEQTQTEAGVYNGKSHPLVALPMAFPWERDSKACRMSSVRFRQLGAIVELQLYSSDETLRSEKISSVAFKSEAPIAGDFSFNLTTVKKDDKKLTISGYKSKMATTWIEKPAAIPASKDEASRVYLTIAPGEYTGQIVVETNVAQYTFTLTEAMTFERAVIKGLPADLAEAERGEINPDASIHFIDPEVKRICVENWDTNSDGQLSYREAAAVTEIGSQFNQTSISSFNELRYFTGLQSIKGFAFIGCHSLKSIQLPDGVTAIGNGAFLGCRSLTSIQLPDGVTSIGNETFAGCSSLTSIHLPDGVTAIGNNAFEYCSKLTSIHLADGLTSIGNNAFANCSSLTSITIPDGVTTIGNDAFRSCSNLTSIKLSDGLTTIGSSAFQSCSSLTSIAIPAGVTSIGDYAFRYCSSLTNITIPEGVTTIGESAFRGCSSLTSITIPAGVTSIGEIAFWDCSSLTSIHLPDGLTSIGNNAFWDCRSLTSINIPDGLTSIGTSAFVDCSSLTSIHLPDGVTSIGNHAFNGCSSLTSINIPQSVSSIGRGVFAGCSSLSAFEGKYASADQNYLILDGELFAFAPGGLTEYKIPEGVTTIGDSAFSRCSSLKSITIPDGVTTIGDFAFSGCSSLKSINIPQTVSSISRSAFYNCPSLSVFDGEYASADQHCLIRDGELFAFAPGGLTEYTIPEGVTTIGQGAFSGCSTLTSITIPAGVTSIGESAFSDCSSLTSIHLADGLTSIGRGTFSYCSSLTSINIPNGVTAIGDLTFDGCSSLTSIHLPDGLTTIGYKAFDCRSLTSISIPQTVSSISEEAFIYCTSLSAFYGKYASADHRCLIKDGTLLAFAPGGLTEYTIPEGVNRIGNTVFSRCSGLTSITIPEGVTSIGDYAFERCENLTNIYCKPATPPTLGNYLVFSSSARFYVPAASVDAYKTAEHWRNYDSRIFADNN